MNRLIATIALLAFFGASMKAQSLERKLFSNGGGNGTVGLNTFSVSFGEPVVGTDQSSIPYLTRGFHQPIPLVLLRTTIMGPLTLEEAGGHLKLNWHTEVNGSAEDFLVEYAEQGNRYEALHLEMAQEVADTLQTYQYVHLEPKAGYYRIRMRLMDGQSVQGQPVFWQPGKEDTSWELGYEPGTRTWTLRGGPDRKLPGKLSLWNLAGQQLSMRSFNPDTQVYPVFLADLPEGLYLLRVEQGGKAYTFRLRNFIR